MNRVAQSLLTLTLLGGTANAEVLSGGTAEPATVTNPEIHRTNASCREQIRKNNLRAPAPRVQENLVDPDPESGLIMSAFFNQDPKAEYKQRRYFDRVFHRRFLPEGEEFAATSRVPLSREEGAPEVELDYQGMPLKAFFRFDSPSDSLDVQYAVVFATGIMSVRVMSKTAYENKGLSWQAAVKNRIRSYEFLVEHGVQSPMLAGYIENEDWAFFIEPYDPGPTFAELAEMKNRHEIDNRQWKQITDEYAEFAVKLRQAMDADDYPSVFPTGSVESIAFPGSEVNYVEGKWTLTSVPVAAR